MNYIPLKINGKQRCEIFEPDVASNMTTSEMVEYSLSKHMYPTSVEVDSETYSRNAERTADYELLNLLLVNRKAKATFTWDLLEADYVKKLFQFLNYTYDFKDAEGVIVPVEAEDILITYIDLTGERTMITYLGQTIHCEFVVYDDVLYAQNLTISFPER